MVRQRAASLDTLSAKGRMQMRIGDGVPSEQLLPFAEALHASGQGITAEDADESSLVEALRLMAGRPATPRSSLDGQSPDTRRTGPLPRCRPSD